MGYLSVDTVWYIWLLVRYHERSKIGNWERLAYDRSSPCVLPQQRPGGVSAYSILNQVRRKTAGEQEKLVEGKKALSTFCMYYGEHGVWVIQTFHGWDVCLSFLLLTLYTLKNLLLLFSSTFLTFHKIKTANSCSSVTGPVTCLIVSIIIHHHQFLVLDFTS